MFFAQGYATAQDRLFQMELWRRAGQGTLAEILGATFLQRDIGARLLRYRGDMAEEYGSYAPDGKQILEAFTDGINAYIKTISAPGGRLPSSSVIDRIKRWLKTFLGSLNHSEGCFLLLTIQAVGKLFVQGLAIFRTDIRVCPC
jgi:hypothetical protein